jgi:hypothetical protein
MAVEDWKHYPRYKVLSEELIAAIEAKMSGNAHQADVDRARQKLDDFWDEVDA